MPLYVLGFMGMTRRLNATTNPEWVPYLYVAMFGAVMIAVGIACQLIQLYVSVRDRNKPENVCDHGDPWNAHTLEWSTSSPPPFYNFAVLPKADVIDPFTEAKETAPRTRLRPSTSRSTCPTTPRPVWSWARC